MNAVVTTEHEMPVFFDAHGETLFGVLTSPPADSKNVAAILLPGSGIPCTHRNRLWVRIARDFAEAGYHAFRFDYHGSGESSGELGIASLKQPFTHDLEGAVRWLESQGLKDFILVGSCFGTRTALSYAHQIPNLHGMMLLAPPVVDEDSWEARNENIRPHVRRATTFETLRRLSDPAWRRQYLKTAKGLGRVVLKKVRRVNSGDHAKPDEFVNPRFLEWFTGVLARGIPIRLVYGESEDFHKDFELAKRLVLEDPIKQAGDAVEVFIIPGEVHRLADVRLQDTLVDLANDWLRHRVGA